MVIYQSFQLQATMFQSHKSILKAILFSLLIGVSSACIHEDIVEGDYPDSVIYLPLANNGILTISAMDESSSPRFTIENNQLTIPIGIYRSGIGRLDEVLVAVDLNLDTLAALSIPNLQVLPQSALEYPNSVQLNRGIALETINLRVNLSAVFQNPEAMYGFAIGISSEQVPTNPALSTLLVLIDPRFLLEDSNMD